jgi:hypothetical protein
MTRICSWEKSATCLTNVAPGGVLQMRKELFQPTAEGEARLLILINVFTTGKNSLEGRTKLAKLDFLLRYPQYFRRALLVQAPHLMDSNTSDCDDTIETRMLRYRYGPWDPAYFGILGSLIGRGLVLPVPTRTGIGYRTTASGQKLAARIGSTEPWQHTVLSARLLKAHFDKRGTWLKDFIYRHFPEVVESSWGQTL